MKAAFSVVILASVLFATESHGQKLCYPDSNPKTTQAYLVLLLRKAEVQAKRAEQLVNGDWPTILSLDFELAELTREMKEMEAVERPKVNKLTATYGNLILRRISLKADINKIYLGGLGRSELKAKRQELRAVDKEIQKLMAWEIGERNNCMMKGCPECGSNEIVSESLVFSGDATTNERPPYVKLVEPAPAKVPFIWLPKSVAAGFRALSAANVAIRGSTRNITPKFWKPTAKATPARITRLKIFYRSDCHSVARLNSLEPPLERDICSYLQLRRGGISRACRSYG